MKQKKKYRLLTNNIYAFLALKILLTFVVLLLTQVFFYCANTRIFHVDGFGEWMGILWGNLIFGMATIGLALLPYLAANLLPFSFRWNKVFRNVTEVLLYWLPSLFLIIANVCDAAYYQFTYRRLSGEIFRYLGIGGQMGALVPHFLIDYAYATIFGVLIMVLFIFCARRIRLLPRDRYRKHLVNDIVGFCLGGLVVFFLFRGGFGHNIHWHDSTKYCQAKNNALVTNSGYNILRTFTGGPLHEVNYIADADAQKLYTPLFVSAYPHDTLAADTTAAPAVQRNVVVIVLESFSQEYMGCYNEGVMPSFTPFLDSLAGHSVMYNGRSNGKKSIEGIPALLTSIPTLMPFPLQLSDYADDSIDALPAILRRNGYHTAFFHGSYNGVMGFDNLCRRCGFDEYHGKDEYVASPLYRDGDYDGCWGIFDEPFLQYMVQQMGAFREPFFSTVFTISSHHPYTMPPQYRGHFPTGEHPLLSVVAYGDNALRKFFDAARQTDWYQNTLFVITADHPGQGLHRQYNDYDGWYRIPMLFYMPDGTTDSLLAARAPGLPAQCRPQARQRLFQQIDLMPTLLDFLGIDANAVCFGTSAFRNADGWQIAYGNGYYQMETADGVEVIGLEEIENGKWKKEPAPKLLSFIQQYNHRLINNQLTY